MSNFSLFFLYSSFWYFPLMEMLQLKIFIEFKENVLIDIVENNNKMFLGLKAKGLISQKELQYFNHKLKK